MFHCRIKMVSPIQASSKADATNLNQTISDFQPRVSKCPTDHPILRIHRFPGWLGNEEIPRYLGGEGNTAKPSVPRSEFIRIYGNP